MIKVLKNLAPQSNRYVAACVQHQQTRSVRMRKPPWVPIAKSKAFRIPPLHEQDPDEKKFMKPIFTIYNTQMRSIYRLFKTEGKFSNKESLLAQEERRVELEKETLLIQKNEQHNKLILEIQLKEEERRLEEKKQELMKQLIAKRELDKKYLEAANEQVKILKEKVKLFIDPNNLEYEIEKMLNERHDYNFSIDKDGNFYKSNVRVDRVNAFNTRFVPPKKNSTPHETANELGKITDLEDASTTDSNKDSPSL